VSALFWKRAGVNVRIAGKGPLLDEYKSVYGTRAGVEFLGHLDAVGVAALLRGAVASVLPSEWYENNPLGVIESLSTGTPVIGAEMGGIPELIIPGKDGFTYPAGDVDALTGLLRDFDSKCFDRAEIVKRADERFSTDAHYSALMDIYKG
jgi:glycosyltransferase involved in cell wall biosynthesis